MWLNNLFFVIPLSEECFVGSMPCLIRALTDHMISLYQSLPLPVGDMCDGSLFGWMFIGLNFSEDNSDSLLLGGQEGFMCQSNLRHATQQRMIFRFYAIQLLCALRDDKNLFFITISLKCKIKVIHVVFHARFGSMFIGVKLSSS